MLEWRLLWLEYGKGKFNLLGRFTADFTDALWLRSWIKYRLK